MKKNDLFWMQRCLDIAVNGRGNVSPNPLVGAVIVKNGKKIGEGYHSYFGGDHAEIVAIKNALRKKHDLAGATIYVNLEPCSHHGKTPPCADAIIRHRLSRVVIAMADPNPLVAGRGIKKLTEHRIRCTVGVKKNEAQLLNETFLTFITAQRPFVALKAAQTADGFIAKSDGTSKWITNSRSRKFVHKLRSEFDAILVGANTVIHDDPKLTVRSVKGKNPLRIVVDGNFNVPTNARVFNDDSRTILYVSDAGSQKKKKLKAVKNRGVAIVALPGKNGRISIKKILADLAQRKVASVFVEGGQKIYSEFINSKYADKVYLFTAPKKITTGIKTFQGISVSYRKRVRETRKFGTDTLKEYSISYKRK